MLEFLQRLNEKRVEAEKKHAAEKEQVRREKVARSKLHDVPTLPIATFRYYNQDYQGHVIGKMMKGGTTWYLIAVLCPYDKDTMPGWVSEKDIVEVKEE